MSWDKGFDFRSTSGYVTDPTDCTYVLGYADAYPVTRNSVTFGWTGADAASVQVRDRDSGIDPRLAGVNFPDLVTQDAVFQVDLLAAGDYSISLALGDAGQGGGYADRATLGDSLSPLASISGTHSGTTFFDMSNAEWTAAQWPGSNVAVQFSFAVAILILRAGNLDDTRGFVAHLFVSQVAGVTYLLT